MNSRSRTSSTAFAALILLVSVAAAQEEASDPAPLSPADLTAEHLGETTTVQGRVLEVERTNLGLHFYLGADTATAFQVFIPITHVHLWTGVDLERRFERRILRATGEIEQDGDRFFITATDPEQIERVSRQRRRR